MPLHPCILRFGCFLAVLLGLAVGAGQGRLDAATGSGLGVVRDGPGGDAPPVAIPPPAPAAEPAPAPAHLLTSLMSFAARSGGIYSLNPAEPSRFIGGLQMGYEHCLVTCQALTFWQSAVAGLKQAIADHGTLESGPDSLYPGQVSIDTRRSDLPEVGFRGLLTPRSVALSRLPLVAGGPGHPATVLYRIQLHDLQTFQGDLHTSNGWQPYIAWCQDGELIVAADLLPQGLANIRFQTIHLIGRPYDPTPGALPPRRARLIRLNQRISQARLISEIKQDTIDASVTARVLTINFDDQGKVHDLAPGDDAQFEGDKALDMPVSDRSQPQLDNAARP